MDSLIKACEAYRKLKREALCIDIEFTGFNNCISVVGIYRPSDGIIEYKAFVRGKNLNSNNLREAFSFCKLLITYNGISSDIPAINKEFPKAIPKDAIMLDLYLIAKELNLNTNLKVLEATLGIERLYEFTKKRRIATKLWKRYIKNKDEKALNDLLEYNKQDTVNLYPIAEQLVSLFLKKMKRD